MPLPIRRRHRVLVRACNFIDQLEPRRLLAAALAADGTLTITGTATADEIGVTVHADNVTVSFNGAEELFPTADVDRVSVLAGGGDDNITSDFQSPLNIPFTIRGESGNDDLFGSPNNDSIDGGTGNDTILASHGSDTVRGGDGNDILYAEVDLPDTLDGGTGAFDTAFVGASQTRLNAEWFFQIGETDYTVTLNGTAGNDTIVADNAGNVTVNGYTTGFFGLATRWLVNGNAGNDKVTISNSNTKPATIKGGAGNDSLIGGGGNDLLDGGTGGDTIKGGGGNDTVDYSTRTGAVTVGLGTMSDDGEANEHDNVATDIETILGGSGADNLKGAANNNRIEGRGGNDTLIGLGGNDTLVGGAGSDRLEGGDGTDTGIDTAGDTLVSIESTSNGTGGGASAVITADQTLLITGTSGIDNVHIGYTIDNQGDDANVVTINGKATTFKQTAFERVEVNALGGNDLVNLDVPQFGRTRLNTPVLINLGDGNDRVDITESGATVNGGNGNDSVVAEDGGALFNGDGGVDYYEVTRFDIPLDVTLAPTTENGRLIGNNGSLTGNALNNKLEGLAPGAVVRGLGGNDLLIGSADFSDTVTLDGGEGNDTLQAQFPANNDGEFTFLGGPGNDSMIGGLGDDYFDGGTGGDTVKGGGGNDTIDYSSRTAPVTVGLGTLSDDGEANEHDNIAIDIETIIGGSGADNLKGHNNNNRIEGRGGNDTLIGLGGNDTLVGGPGSDRLEGGDGNDTGIDTAGDTLISIENTSGGGNETFIEDADGNVTVNGTAGDDTTIVSKDIAGNGQIVVTFNGATRRFDADATVTVFGRGGQDRFTANRETSVIFHGEAGQDQFNIDESVNSTLFGGDDNDLFVYHEFASLRPQHDGGAGIDMVDYTGQHGAVLDLRNGVNMENGTVGNFQNTIIGTDADNVLFASDSFGTAFTLQGLGGQDSLYGSDEADVLEGGAGDDLLYGRDGNDTIRAGDGNDTLNGGDGSDHLEGNNGNDVMHGDAGNDRLFGGNGDDRLFGDAGDDLLYGQNNADTLDGGDGSNDRGFDDGQDTLTNIEQVLT